MDKKYITLFQKLAQDTSATSEIVMDYDRQKNDEQGLEAATQMRDDFQEFTDKIKNAGDSYIPTRYDIARLLVASMIQTKQIQHRINALKEAMTGYQTDVIPKLQAILDGSTDDETVAKLVNEKFIIENNK